MNDEKYGTEPHKLHRKNGPETSMEAAYSINSTNMAQRVHRAIKTFPDGCIQDDLIAFFGADMPYSSVTSRVSELVRTGKVHKTGEKRKGKTHRRQFVIIDGPAPDADETDGKTRTD